MAGSKTSCGEKILLLTLIPLQIIQEKIDLKMLISDPTFLKFCVDFLFRSSLSNWFSWF